MDFKTMYLYLIGVISCLLYLVSYTEGHSIMKRNAWQMCDLVHRYTRRSCLSYSPYGCFCGFGQQGTQPTDSADSCCKDHDDCYGRVTDNNHCQFWSQIVGYNYQCGDGDDCRCTDDLESSECARLVCECDLTLAQCLGNSDYNPYFKHFNRRRCL